MNCFNIKELKEKQHFNFAFPSTPLLECNFKSRLSYLFLRTLFLSSLLGLADLLNSVETNFTPPYLTASTSMSGKESLFLSTNPGTL